MSLSAFKGTPTEEIMASKYSFQVAKLNKLRRNLILSRREFVQKEREQVKEKIWGELKKGDTRQGTVKGITRMGIIGDKNSVLARASFETAVKQFVQATKTGKKDRLASVIENIILNQPVPVGTGLPGLVVKVTGPLVKKESEKVNSKKKQ